MARKRRRRVGRQQRRERWPGWSGAKHLHAPLDRSRTGARLRAKHTQKGAPRGAEGGNDVSDSLSHRLMVAADAFETLGAQAHDPAITTTTCSEHAKLLREAERGIAEARYHYEQTFSAYTKRGDQLIALEEYAGLLKTERDDLKHDVDRLLAACNGEVAHAE